MTDKTTVRKDFMEIERKYLVGDIPYNLSELNYHDIEQAYLCTKPVVRIRKQDNDYILTYKGSGMMAREEYNLPLTQEAYEHLKEKADGNIISKRRYLIPIENDLTIELDVFNDFLAPLILAEVEFPSESAANNFIPPNWFTKDVTFNKKFHNSYLSKVTKEDKEFV